MKKVVLAASWQIQKFHGLLHSLGIRAQKETLLSSFGVMSTKALTYEQMQDLLVSLERENTPVAVKEVVKKEASPELKRERSIVIDLLSKLGIYTNSDSWTAVNEYLMLPKIAGKKMVEMSEEELKALQKKLRAIYTKQSTQQGHWDYLAKNN